MAITNRQRRWLKARAHPLRPIVSVGQAGVTESVLAELDGALAHHELLKVKVAAGGDREERDAAIEMLVEASGAELVGRIGNVAVLYRPSPKKRDPIVLPA